MITFDYIVGFIEIKEKKFFRESVYMTVLILKLVFNVTIIHCLL